MVRDELYKSIWESLALQQRKARMISLTLGGGEDTPGASLSYAEGLILLILNSGQGDKNVGEIAGVLKLERSWVSRIISSLEERRLLDSYSPDDDKRSKKLRISKKGNETLDALLSLRARVVQETFSDLSEAELEELAALLKELADGLQAPPYRGHAIDGELIRLSWVLGVVGENFMESGLNVSRFQILFELARRGSDFVTGSDISWVFPVDISTVARTLTFFNEEGLAERKQASDDARRQLVRLSARGRKKWGEICSVAGRIVEKALKDMPEQKLLHLKEFLERVAREIPGRHRNAAEPKVEVRKIKSEELAGYFGKDTPPEVFKTDDSGDSFGLYQSGQLKGVMQISGGKMKDDLSVCMAASGVNAARILRFIKAGARLAR